MGDRVVEVIDLYAVHLRQASVRGVERDIAQLLAADILITIQPGPSGGRRQGQGACASIGP